MSASKAAQDPATLLLNGLPPRTQLILDAHSEAYVTNEQFAGIKELPAGWHCVSWSIPALTSSSDQADATEPSSTSTRNVLLRWFDADEVAVRELDRVQQRLVASLDSGIGRSRRRHVTRTVDPSSSGSIPTIVSPDVLASVEPRLLPYPSAAQDPWGSATRHLSQNGGHVGRQVVAKVLGVESTSGDSITDSFATGPSSSIDEKEKASLQRSGNLGRNEKGKVIWGKSRPAPEPFEVAIDGEADHSTEDKGRKRTTAADSNNNDDDDDELLYFTSFDLRRSWPPNSVGSEITRWSQDKSWLLQDVARRCFVGIIDPSKEEWYLPLLCELELAFILFVTANNVYAFEQWKDLVALFCRSAQLIGAQSGFQPHPSTTSPLVSAEHAQPDLDSHVAFLHTLRSQLSLLTPDFWSSQSSPHEESHVLTQLDVLRASIARSLSSTAATSPQRSPRGGGAEHLIKAWRSLSHFTTVRFGWHLDQRLDEEAEVQGDLEAEQGEDAPVVVDL
ncbi:hypothetical protein EX895_006032 [Sporisorium graminicola]|uniref:Uncharacterized protein n=1 Tax=Sporisorium graminicola TaxID=280036 RepID=A0A4U7KPP6_9BASI|nr:hypothetical protein EX895_006032 [Sporisorium graminicola]TKY84952.1 hypothetical protein EX895_006032 [Sporisorium graminicola]